MKKSRYCKMTRINDDVYALYNSLLMEPIFVNKKIAKKVKYNKLKNISEKQLEELKKIGVIVNSNEQDIKCLKLLRNEINEEIKNKASIMYIIPNNNCNLMCKYCFIGKLNNEHPVKMTYETMQNAVEKYVDYVNTQDYQCKIMFYGGEPLISFDNIKKISEYIKNKGYDFQLSMVTNGLLLNDEIIDFLKEHNFSVGISIDGPKKINDLNRITYGSKNGTYDIVKKNIKKLDAKNVNYGLSITISKDLLKIQDEFFEWLEELKPKSFSYNMMHYTHKTDEWKKYYVDVTRFLIKSNNLFFDKGYSEDRVRRKYVAFYDRDFKYSDCAARGGNQFAVKPNGDIVICHGFWNTKENLIGNINDININDIFNTNRYKEWNRNIPLNNKKCQNCKALYTCGGGCAMQSRDLFGNERKIDKAFCIHTKIIQDYILKELFYNDVLKK